MDNSKQNNYQHNIENYKELNVTGRHYDYQFWLIPVSAYTLSITLYGVANSELFNNQDLFRQMIYWAIPMITFGLLIQMINERAYQIINKNRL